MSSPIPAFSFFGTTSIFNPITATVVNFAPPTISHFFTITSPFCTASLLPENFSALSQDYRDNKVIIIAACEIVQEDIMIDQKEVMAKKVQAVARGYISRKNTTGDQKTDKAQGGGDHTVKPGDATPNEEAQAKIIQGAFRKYKGSSKKN